MSSKRSYRSGLTLTEVVLSVALLTLVWLATVEVMVMSKIGSSLARHKVQSIHVMQRAIEDLRRKPFASIISATSTVSIDSRGTPDNYTDDFTGTQVVTVTSPSQYYKKVVVELRWNELLFGKTKTFREYLGTYIANDPQAN